MFIFMGSGGELWLSLLKTFLSVEAYICPVLVCENLFHVRPGHSSAAEPG